jgi:hypothetical protein
MSFEEAELEPFLFWLTVAVAVGALVLVVSRGDFETPPLDKGEGKGMGGSAGDRWRQEGRRRAVGRLKDGAGSL